MVSVIKQSQRLIVIVTALMTALCVTDAVAGKCRDSVKIGAVKYPLNNFWCGKAIPKFDLAYHRGLVLIPQNLTLDDFQITVLPQTRKAFIKMAKAAKKDSVFLIADSGFRSRAFQRKIIRERMATGLAFREVILSVAPPGYSEHHTGRALDLAPSEIEFATSKTYRWLKQNAAKFGFYETMPRNPEGPAFWEPWHWSWQGDRLASAVK